MPALFFADGGPGRSDELLLLAGQFGVFAIFWVSLALSTLCLGLWGLAQFAMGRGRWPKDWNRLLGFLKACVAANVFGSVFESSLIWLAMGFVCVWMALELYLRKKFSSEAS